MVQLIVGGVVAIAIAVLGDRSLRRLDKQIPGLLIVLGFLFLLAGILSQDALDLSGISADTQAIAAAVVTQGLLYYRLQSTLRKEIHDDMKGVNDQLTGIVQRLASLEARTPENF